jgi:hypothetical protein
LTFAPPPRSFKLSKEKIILSNKFEFLEEYSSLAVVVVMVVVVVVVMVVVVTIFMVKGV